MQTTATVSQPRSFGGTTLHVTGGPPGDLVYPVNLAVIRSGGVQTVLTITSWVGGVLTVSGPASGVTDAAVSVGDVLSAIGGAYVPVRAGDTVDTQGRAIESVSSGLVTSVATRTGDVTLAVGDIAGAAPTASPVLTGYATIPAHGGPITADTDGATITFDLSVTDWHSVTLGGNRTLAVANVGTGQQFSLVLVQDGTGSRTVTWFSGIKWAGGSAPTLTTTAGKADIVTLKQYAANSYYGFVAGANC